MAETGVVVGIKGDTALIEMEASKDCESCGACRYTKTGRMMTEVTNSLGAAVGDIVKIDIEPKTVIVAALVVYFLPIALFFLGYAIGAWTGGSANLRAETTGLVGGLVFLFFSYFSVRAIDEKARLSRRFEPQMRSIVSKQ